jgi:hypothetical protein
MPCGVPPGFKGGGSGAAHQIADHRDQVAGGPEHHDGRGKAIDQDELIAWLNHQGIQAGPFETRYGAGGFGPSIYIQDPDGNTLELRPAQQAG